MDKIKGLIDAPFTPFYENGEVNYEPIEDYAKLLVKNGLKGAGHQAAALPGCGNGSRLVA